MDEEIERLMISVRADTQGFARDVEQMRGLLDGSLGGGAERAGRMIENSLVRAVRTGKLGFDDLKRVALSALSEIGGAAIRGGLGSLLGGGSIGGLIGGLLGLPGRATGGPVAPGRGYLVGERGPEVFVPTASGRIEAGAPARDVRVTINLNAGAAGRDAPEALARSSRQVAKAVKAALAGVD
jgi:hypothetical protein